jgi:hypothetical protein
MNFEDPIREMGVLYETVLNLYTKVGELGIKRNNLWVKTMAIDLKSTFDKKHLNSEYFNRNYKAIMGMFE